MMLGKVGHPVLPLELLAAVELELDALDVNDEVLVDEMPDEVDDDPPLPPAPPAPSA